MPVSTEQVMKNQWGSVRPYTYHSKSCPYKTEKNYNSCRCAKWLYIHPKDCARRRFSLGTPSWTEALSKAAEELEALHPEISRARAENKKKELALKTVLEAIQMWLDRTASEFGLKSRIWWQYRSTFGWIDSNGVTHGKLLRYVEKWNAVHPEERVEYIQQITPLWLQNFRDSDFYTKGSPETKSQRWGTIRSFFKFLFSLGVLKSNPAFSIKSPSASTNFANTPYTAEQYDAILRQACRYVDSRVRDGEKEVYCERSRLFLELLRRTGMDLGDAVMFRPTETITSEMSGGELVWVLRYTRQKTGVQAVIPLLEEHAKMFLSIPGTPCSVSGTPFRYRGNLLSSDAHNWGRRIKKLIELSGLRRVNLMGRDGRPAVDERGNQITKAPNVKMLRHTFAVGELVAGVPIEAVAREMGHVDTEMLRTKYAPWVPERDRAHIAVVIKSRSV